MRFIPLEKQLLFTDGYRRCFSVQNQHVLLINEKGKAYAINAFCPHKQWPLIEAPITDKVITCPKHLAQFDLETGELIAQCVSDTPKLNAYEVVYEGYHVGVFI
jgi:nitrite reductase/ring-hydroxylating ferredoxin subunit